ncbi:MAG: hypothetical protein AAFU71_14965 [Cyanobacteria bacterium J06632_22]
MLAGLTLLPIWSHEFLPLQDYPNHLARNYIIANYDGLPALRQFYQVKFSILPNLAMDVLVPGLSRGVGIEAAGKVMLSLCLLSVTSGTVALNYALFGRFNVLPLCSFLLVFNQAFLKGFVNFSFGAGLALWGVALWLLSERWNRWVRLVGFSGLTVVLFFCHLYALGIYAVVVIAYEMAEVVRTRLYRKPWPNIALLQKLSFWVQFAIPVLLYRLSPTGSDAFGEPRWNSAVTKLKALWKLTDDYSLSLGVLTLIVVMLLPLLGTLLKQLQFSRNMGWPLVTLALLYIALPKELSTSANADWRLLVPLSFLWIASFQPCVQRRQYGWLGGVGLAAVAILLSVRISVVQSIWASYQPTYQAVTACIAQLEPGQRLFTAMAHENYDSAIPTMHLPTYAVIQKSALVPSLFAFETQQPVQFQPPYQSLADQTRRTVYSGRRAIPWDTVLSQYDYVLLENKALFPSVPLAQLRPVHEAGDFTLLQVKRS